MGRFQQEKSSSSKNIVVSVIGFFIILGCFYISISSVSATSSKEQKKSLVEAVNRSIIHCYAVEGAYPESLDYLMDNYGISYDSKKFFVDYQTLGANIMPDITIIEKESK